MLRTADFLWLGMSYSHFLSSVLASCCFNTNLPCIFHLFTSVFLLFFSSFTSFFPLQLSHEMTFDEQFDQFANKVCLAEVVDWLDVTP